MAKHISKCKTNLIQNGDFKTLKAGHEPIKGALSQTVQTKQPITPYFK